MINRREFVASAAALAALPPSTASAASEPLAFLGIGDWGRDGTNHQREVGAQMGIEGARIGSRFTIAVGDNFYDNGVKSVTDPQWKSSFEDVYTAPALQKPWYVVLGNHDYRGNPQAQIDYSKKSPRWRMPSRYWVQKVREGGVEVDLFMLDTSPMVRRYTSDEDAAIRQNVADQDVQAQMRWLERELAASRAPWKLAFGHHPVFSGGKHGDTAELVEQVRPLFEKYGVQAYVNGHDHDLQHIERGGVAYICTGAGSETRPVKAVEGTRFCKDLSGFTSYALTPELLTVQFRDYTGQLLHTGRIARATAGAKAAA